MAEGDIVEGKSLEELQREITCGICKEHYTEPKILPCLHYYCKQCVLGLATRTGVVQPFSCPECCSEATLPKGGVDELKTPCFIDRLKTTVTTMERAHGKVEVKCELCSDSEDKAEAFCRQCGTFICKDCIRQHKRLKPFLTHEVASLEDLNGRAEEIAVKEPLTTLCSIHKQPQIVYCFDCGNLICYHCTTKDHWNHSFEFCKKVASKTKESLLEELEPLKKRRESLVLAIDNIEIAKWKIMHQEDSVAEDIRAAFRKLESIMKNREQELLGRSAGILQEKMEKLALQEENLSAAIAVVQSVVDYTEQCVRHCTDNEVMSMHTEIKRQIEQKIEEQSKSGSSLEPVEEADIGVEVSFAEALQQLCQTQANIVQQPLSPALDQPQKPTNTTEDNIHCEANEKYNSLLVASFVDPVTISSAVDDHPVKPILITEDNTNYKEDDKSDVLSNTTTLSVDPVKISPALDHPDTKSPVTTNDNTKYEKDDKSNVLSDTTTPSIDPVKISPALNHPDIKSPVTTNDDTNYEKDDKSNVLSDTAMCIDLTKTSPTLDHPDSKSPNTTNNNSNCVDDKKSVTLSTTTLSIDPAKCSVTLEEDSSHEVNKVSTAILETRLSNNELSNRSHTVSCFFTALHNNCIADCQVTPAGGGQYSIQYKPTVRGRHKLTVSVDGQQVAGSPIPFFVSIHPAKLDKPVEVWRDLAYPRGIAMSPAGEILICDSGKIVKYNRFGFLDVLAQQNKVKSLWGIDMDDKNIFCINGNSNKILKCDLHGKNIEVREAKHLYKGLRGLAVARHEVMVCENGNLGTIVVYDKELNYKRNIGDLRLGQIWGLSYGSHDYNLYCAGYSSDKIHVITCNGIFLRSFGWDESGERLFQPCSLCIFQQYVYVCNYGSSDISVFTTDGKYVTSLGHHGDDWRGGGDLDWPHSVCVDKDGFVYVTDFNFVTVQYF